jgi:hypothetical protein
MAKVIWTEPALSDLDAIAVEGRDAVRALVRRAAPAHPRRALSRGRERVFLEARVKT